MSKSARQLLSEHMDRRFDGSGVVPRLVVRMESTVVLVNALWSRLVEETPEAFFEHRKKTGDLGLDQNGRVVQKVHIERMAASALVSSPYACEGVFESVGGRDEWVPLEVVMSPMVVGIRDDQETEDKLASVIGDEGEI